MIIDGKLLRQYFPDDVSIRFKCVITKEEFLECYNAWVKPIDTKENNND